MAIVNVSFIFAHLSEPAVFAAYIFLVFAKVYLAFSAKKNLKKNC
jgi:hypothetical protein